MPELPEVETIKRDLERVVSGKKIKNIEISVGKLIKGLTAEELIKRIKGKTFKRVFRRGKYLIFSLSSGEYLVVHLKLTGQLIYGGRDKRSRITFSLSDGKYLNFNDQRLFGEVRLVKEWEEVSGIKEMGIEPLGRDFTPSLFQKMLAGRKTKVKPLLMEQNFLAGIGNIYAQESLFRAKIHPQRPANKLKEREVKDLYSSLQAVLGEAIDKRGSSVDAYLDAKGERGGFDSCLEVYGREGKPCLKCGERIVKVKLGGRGTCFCPRCQSTVDSPRSTVHRRETRGGGKRDSP